MLKKVNADAVDTVIAIESISGNISISHFSSNTNLKVSRTRSIVVNHTVATNTTDYYFAVDATVTHNGITEQYSFGPKDYSTEVDIKETAIYFTATQHSPSNKKVEIAPGGIQAVFLANTTLEHADNKYFRVTPEEVKTVDILGTSVVTGSLLVKSIDTDTHTTTITGGSVKVHGGTQAEPGLQFDTNSDGFFHTASAASNTYVAGINIMVGNSVAAGWDDSDNFHSNGDITAFSTSVNSDIRLKENIKLLKNNLEKVLQLKPSSFRWKIRDKQDDVGLIAQEVEPIMPAVVKDFPSIGRTGEFLNSDEGTHKNVDYPKLTVYLIGAIQEQQEQIDELKKKLEEL